MRVLQANERRGVLQALGGTWDPELDGGDPERCVGDGGGRCGEGERRREVYKKGLACGNLLREAADRVCIHQLGACVC